MNEGLWDVIVIGAGMPGLGAGIRLALAGKKVLLLEQHHSVGGLNGFYTKNKILYDVGLHALTNFVPAGTVGKPLTKLCRQLRIPYEALQLQEQRQSRIQFPGISLCFRNQFEGLVEEIRKHFPKEIDRFLKLHAAIATVADTDLIGMPFCSAREQVQQFLRDPLLIEMILLPLLYYGSAQVNDLDWRQFAILYKAIYQEGFARPKGGVRTLLRLLLERFRTEGGVLRTQAGVRSIDCRDRQVVSVELASGEKCYAKQFFSSIGWMETQMLCGKKVLPILPRLTFMETITTYEGRLQDCGWNDTIVFFNRSDRVFYQPPESFFDERSGVICIPENYGMPKEPSSQPVRFTLRTTHLANFSAWKVLPSEAYRQQRHKSLFASRACAFSVLQGNPPECVVDEDLFTPLTIERFTGHVQGAVYGSPQKFRDGRIGYDNLFLCGTDQGFLGIIGALLSGVSMANYHGLRGMP